MPIHAPTTALERFIPLMGALKARPDLPELALNVENTGGGVMCLFIRAAGSMMRPFTFTDRCIVFSDDWDEPDPTASGEAWCMTYRDWSDASDTGTAYTSAIRYEHGHEAEIAAWAATIIRGWLL